MGVATIVMSTVTGDAVDGVNAAGRGEPLSGTIDRFVWGMYASCLFDLPSGIINHDVARGVAHGDDRGVAVFGDWRRLTEMCGKATSKILTVQYRVQYCTGVRSVDSLCLVG